MGLFDSWSVKDYAIQIANPNVAPGQMLSGNLVFTLTSEMSFRKISFKVIGREYTHVVVRRTTGSGKHRRTSTHHYYGRRNFFKIHITPLGMPKWGNNSWQGTLAAGTYNFPFAVRIPHNALPSMSVGTENNAAIQYFVKSKIDIPFGPDSEVVTNFIVTTAMPEAQAMAAVPFFSDQNRVLRTCCCCDSGFTRVTFSIEKNLLILSPNNVLNGHLTINNAESGEHTKVVTVNLVQHTTLTAQGYTRVALTPVATCNVMTNLEKKQQGDHTFAFQLPLGAPMDVIPRASTFRGELIINTYLLTFVCDGDVLGQLHINAASAVDPTNMAVPVQCDLIASQTVPSQQYPKFLYAAPPGAAPQLPPQGMDVGPFASTGYELPPIPY